MTHFTLNATHRGELMGIPPTGDKVTVTGTGMFHVVDGKIIKWTGNFDYLGIFQQIGLIPPLGEGER
jgi:predicted ester cyclase